MSEFKTKHTYEKRAMESRRILKKYPDRRPIIIEKSNKSNIKNLNKNKYLILSDMTAGHLLCYIRKHIDLKPEEAIFIFINNTLPLISETISQIYDKNVDNDGFLYVTYSTESTFGSL